MSIILSNLNNLLFESEIEIDDKFISIFESVSKTFKQQYADLVKQQEDLVGKKLLHRKMDDPDMGPFNVQSAIAKGPLANPPLHDARLPTSGLKPGQVDRPVHLDDINNPYHLPSSPANVSSSLFKRKPGHIDPADANLHDARPPDPSKLVTDDGVSVWSKMASGAGKAHDFIAQNPLLVGSTAGAVLGAGLLAKYKNSILRGNYLVNHYSKLASQAKNPAEKQQYEQRIAWAKSKLANAQSKARVEHKNFIEKSQRMKSYINELNKAGRKQEAAKLQEKLAKRQRFLSKIGATI